MKRETFPHGFLRFLEVERLTLPNGLVRERVVATDSVNLLIYHRNRDALLLCRESRAGFITADNPLGKSLGTIAGRFDKTIGVRELMAQEAIEETGVTVAPEAIELLNNGKPMGLSEGILTERAYLGFAEVTSAQVDPEERIFGSDPGEEIERVWIPVDQLESYEAESIRAYTLIQWFLLHKIQNRRM